MELLNPSVSNRPLIIPRFSSFPRKFSIKTCINKKPTKFHKYPYLPFHLSFSTNRIVHVSAHFGRPTNRRNSLRKKLIDDQQVRQSNLISLNPSSDCQNPSLHFDNIGGTLENLDNDNIQESGSSYGVSLAEPESAETWKMKSKKLGESILSTKLEEWVDQYNKDTAYWGLGTGPIFTVFHDLKGNVKKVLVHEDEILKRSQIDKRVVEDSTQVNSKVLYAEDLAREMERGENVIPNNSSVAKFFVSSEESSFINTIRDVALQPEFIPVISGFGKMMFCGLVAIGALKKLFTYRNKEDKLTESEKEMMRRKIKSRREKETLEEGKLEVIQEPSELPIISTEKPKLDKQELMKNILETKAWKDKLVLVNSYSSHTTSGMDFDEKILKIREMAKEAREMESGDQPVVDKDRKDKQLVNDKSSSGREMLEVISIVSNIQNGDSGQSRDMVETRVQMSLDGSRGKHIEYLNELSSSAEDSNDRQTVTKEAIHSSDTCDGELNMPEERSFTMRPRIIRSVKEAKEFLAKKGNKHSQVSQINPVQESTIVLSPPSDKLLGGKTGQRVETDKQVLDPVNLGKMPDPLAAAKFHQDSILKLKELVSIKEDDYEDSDEGYEVHDLQNSQKLSDSDINCSKQRRQHVETENWMEKNFHEVETIIKKIGDGFRDNYKIAKEKVNQHTNTGVTHLDYNEDDSELEWMKDDDLREIVFQVRENELAGRDPFYLMDAEDKLKFLEGLEKKVEKENEQLFQVHEYLHSNIENLDYGADGISLYDPPEKFIPCWKGPPLEKNSDFLNNFLEQRNAIFAGMAGTSYLMKKDEQNLVEKSTESPVNENAATLLSDNALENLRNKNPKVSKTVIEGSDGSVRAGTKKGKEYWQHTKKWSRGFLESYNSETDPEMKSIMKDIGKDLDRWITEEEIQEAADLMKKFPERNKKFMEKKINKLKREMELFGPQAVVSKYREYAEEKEEDYLWWLDLPHVLCIELYTTQNGEQKIGFYSLEMAADLELEQKPYHVIAFEDAGDCKNLCCIIQAHMDMLGNGHAFVVPRPPKDAFREAKANGFGVTVIRKKELQLNVDQTLEEVEEQITEIGSKMYNDKLMRERSVDISALMKGVFGVNGQTASTKRKRSKRKLKKPGKK